MNNNTGGNINTPAAPGVGNGGNGTGTAGGIAGTGGTLGALQTNGDFNIMINGLAGSNQTFNSSAITITKLDGTTALTFVNINFFIYKGFTFCTNYATASTGGYITFASANQS